MTHVPTIPCRARFGAVRCGLDRGHFGWHVHRPDSGGGAEWTDDVPGATPDPIRTKATA